MVRILSVRCPHCDSRARVRSSRAATRVVTDLYVDCHNGDCNHSFAAQIVVIHTISPSAMPHPAVHLPVAPPRARMRRPANDNDADQVAQA